MELEIVTAPELKAYFSLLVRVPLTEKEVCLSLAEVNCNTLDKSLEKMYKCYLCDLGIDHDKIF